MRILARAALSHHALPKSLPIHKFHPIHAPLSRASIPSTVRTYAIAASQDTLAEVYQIPADLQLSSAEEFIVRAKEHDIDPQAAHKYWACADGYLKAMKRGGPSWERLFIRGEFSFLLSQSLHRKTDHKPPPPKKKHAHPSKHSTNQQSTSNTHPPKTPPQP
jgi:hypothetical protein